MKKLFFLVLLFSGLVSQAQVVINEVYGGGGNSGAPYTNDFVELYNKGNAAITMTNWSIQYTSSTGTSWGSQKVTFSGSIAAGGYYLLQLGGGTNGDALPTADASGTFNMSATGGKIALLSDATSLTGTCPSGGSILDLVGFGTSANCSEGGNAPTTNTPAPSNTLSISRNNTHDDTNVNSADFTTGAPSPTNSTGPDVIPPTVTTLSPANGSTGIALTVNSTLSFNENVAKGTAGSITLKKLSDNAVVQTIDITSNTVTISQKSVSFTIAGLDINTAYYYNISAGAIKDVSGNDYAGINDNSTWNFTTGNGVFTGTLDFTYDLEGCTSNIPDGFYQYSVTGPQTWACTTFGRDPSSPAGSAAFGHAVQINGFSGTNILNQDWFISPVFDLSSTTFPLLSFWSRTAFNGAPLQLKVSTDYDGAGDPNNFTWTDVDGKFPAQTSNVWTLTDNVDLSTFKSANTYFAFVYTSTVDDGARWTLDDIKVTNSPTAPPASLSTNTNALQFGFVPNSTASVKTFVINASNLTGGLTLTSSTNFLVSKTNGAFTSSITYTAAEINNVASTVYVQFIPTAPSTNYPGSITLTTTGVTGQTILLQGNSIDEASTLEVVNWNVEWFGSMVNGPTNKNLQEANIKTITQNIHADVFALAEVVDEARLQNVVANLNAVYGAGTYAYTLCNYGSHTNPFESGAGPLSEAQKEALIYKTAVVSIIGTPGPLVTEGANTALDLNNPAYNYFSSGRYPYMVNTNVTLGGITKQVRFVVIHAKANTSPTTTAYNRRKAGSDTLNYTLNTLYPNDNIILLGDFNDDLDQSITAGFTTTSYSAFTNDPADFFSPTLALSLAGRASTVSYNDVIDHVELSNEMQSFYMSNTADILKGYTTTISSYGTTTSDHYPVFTRYAFDPLILPVTFTGFTATKENTVALLKWTTAKEFNVKSYDVQRSADGVHFSVIGNVAAQQNPSYLFTDVAPLAGKNYYRLIAQDIDGKKTISETRLLDFTPVGAVLLYPNPAKDKVVVRMTNATTTETKITILSLDGENIKTIISTSANININTSNLSKGLYYFKIQNGDFIKTEKLLVQ